MALWRGRDERQRAEAERAAQDTESSLIGALQDSDTPGEMLHDEIDDAAHTVDDPAPVPERRPVRGLIGAATLALIAVLVARRRR